MITDLYSLVFPQFWFTALGWAGGYVIEKGVDYLLNWLFYSRDEIRTQRQQASNLPYRRKSEKNEIINYCDQAEKALNRLENYINKHRYEHKKIKSFLKILYEEELQPLAKRMDNVEAKLQYINSWKRNVERRQREWDTWRTNIEQRMVRLEHRTSHLEHETVQTKKVIRNTQTRLSSLEYKLLPKLVFNIHYQWLEIFEEFWDQQFGETQIANHNKVDYE